MYFLYKKEHRIFKPAAITKRRGLKQKGEKQEVNQFGLQYIYTWKCHKEMPWVAIFNKNVIFFFYKIREQDGRTGPV
jgi:hypothetical protein